MPAPDPNAFCELHLCSDSGAEGPMILLVEGHYSDEDGELYLCSIKIPGFEAIEKAFSERLPDNLENWILDQLREALITQRQEAAMNRGADSADDCWIGSTF